MLYKKGNKNKNDNKKLVLKNKPISAESIPLGRDDNNQNILISQILLENVNSYLPDDQKLKVKFITDTSLNNPELNNGTNAYFIPDNSSKDTNGTIAIPNIKFETDDDFYYFIYTMLHEFKHAHDQTIQNNLQTNPYAIDYNIVNNDVPEEVSPFNYLTQAYIADKEYLGNLKNLVNLYNHQSKIVDYYDENRNFPLGLYNNPHYFLNAMSKFAKENPIDLHNIKEASDEIGNIAIHTMYNTPFSARYPIPDETFNNNIYEYVSNNNPAIMTKVEDRYIPIGNQEFLATNAQPFPLEKIMDDFYPSYVLYNNLMKHSNPIPYTQLRKSGGNLKQKRQYDYYNYQTGSKINDNEKAAKDAKDFTIGWLNSPKHNELLYNSVGENEESKKNIQNQRLSNIEESNVNFTNPDGKYLNKYIGNTYNYFKKNPSLSTNAYTANGLFDYRTNDLYINPTVKDKNSTIVHEYSHSTDIKNMNTTNKEPKYNIPEKDIELMKKSKIIKEDDNNVYYNYVSDPSETRARLNTLRHWLKESNITDPYTKSITSDDLIKLKEYLKNKYGNDYYNNNNNDLKDLFDLYGIENTVNMLNKISMDTNNKYNNIVKYGGNRQKYQITS